MTNYEKKLNTLPENTKLFLKNYYSTLGRRKNINEYINVSIDFCIEFLKKKMNYITVIDYICRAKQWTITYLNYYLKYYSFKNSDELLLNITKKRIEINSRKYSFVYLKDLSLFPLYYDFLIKCSEAKYSFKRMYDCSWLFIKYLNVLGINKDNIDVKTVWYSFKYDFEINSIQNYYKNRTVLIYVDFRSCSRNKIPNEYKEVFFKEYLKERIEKEFNVNKKTTYDFLVNYLDTKDYETSAILKKMLNIKKFNDFLDCDYSLLTQKKVEEFIAIHRKNDKRLRTGVIYSVGELVEYLNDNKILKSRIVVTIKESKYPPVYIYEYADEKDEIRANKDRELKYIWFNKLEYDDCLNVLTKYTIHLLSETVKPYISIQSIINLLCDLANYTKKQFDLISKDDFLNYFDKYRRKQRTTKNTYYVYFHEFYEWLYQNKIVKCNIVCIEYAPIDYIDKNVSYSAYEMQVIFNNMNKLPDDMYRLALVLLVATGMRISEIVSIRRSMIKKIDGLYFIMVKSDKAERFQKSYISKSIYEYIKNYIEKHPSKTDFLFVNRFGNKTRTGSIAKILRDYPIDNDLRNESGEIIKINPHKFRHNIAVSLQNSGAPITIIQRILNHNSLETTKHYIDNAIELVRKRRMEALGINEVASSNVPKIRDSYENLINSDSITQILISGACKKKAYTTDGKKCSNNPNECYKCNLFFPDKSKLDDYKSQLKEMLLVRDRYVQNGKEIEAIEIEDNIYALTNVIEKIEVFYQYEESNSIRQLSI